jgi:hypothetical protein
MEGDKNLTQQSPPTKPKQSLQPNWIEWTESLAGDLIEQWYRKYSSSPITKLLLYNFFIGKKEVINLDFNIKISDADLVRIGYMLGMDYAKMNKAFLKYRLRYGRGDKLNSNYRPKTKQSFMEGADLVKDLQEFLKLHSFPFIYSLQSSQEKVEYIDELIQDDELNLRGVDEQIAELEEQRNQVLNRIENLEKLKEKISLTC